MTANKNVLLLEGIDPEAAMVFGEKDFVVERMDGSLGEETLKDVVPKYVLLGVRSKTKITRTILEAATSLQAIGSFCIGTDNIDLNTCLDLGIPVFNAPHSNTRSVAELALGEMIMLGRRTFDKSMNMHDGVWNKTAEGCHELRGLCLGIVGYGHIGSQLSVLAEHLGMTVIYFDVAHKQSYGNAAPCKTLDELLEKADFVTLHVSGEKRNKGFFGDAQFAKMKKGAYFLNLSRGFVVDLLALKKSIERKHLAGAAVDVFPQEPEKGRFNCGLLGLPNVILTPHDAGNTKEAQVGIARLVPSVLMSYLESGTTSLSVNFPRLTLDPVKDAHRFVHIHRNVPGIMAQINNVFSRNKINILAQHLKTNEKIGYAITDVNKEYNPGIVHDLNKIQDTIKVRVLY